MHADDPVTFLKLPGVQFVHGPLWFPVRPRMQTHPVKFNSTSAGHSSISHDALPASE